MISDEQIVKGVKKWLEIIKKECPDCYKMIEKCCDDDCCK